MNFNTQTLENHWQEILGKLQEKWGSLNEQDLQRARGDAQQFVKAIQQKTGETREAIQAFLDELVGQYAGTVQQAAEMLREYANRMRSRCKGRGSRPWNPFAAECGKPRKWFECIRGKRC